jgi:tetratricopeptide (TPR) repeat protein
LEIPLVNSPSSSPRREADQKKEGEALDLHRQGTILYKNGKMKEAADKLEEAIEIYEQAAAVFDEAIKKKSLNIFFISYTKVIEALMQNSAYDEARNQCDKLKIHFPDEENKQLLQKMEELINDETWSPGCLRSYSSVTERAQTQTIQISNWSVSG